MSVRYSGEWKIFHYAAPEAVQHGCFIKSCFDVETPQERNCNGVSFLTGTHQDVGNEDNMQNIFYKFTSNIC